MKLPVVLCGYETWSLTRSDEAKFRANIKITNDELLELYCKPDIVRTLNSGRYKWGKHQKMSNMRQCDK